MKLITEYTENNVKCIVEKKEDGEKSLLPTNSRNISRRLNRGDIKGKGKGNSLQEQMLIRSREWMEDLYG